MTTRIARRLGLAALALPLAVLSITGSGALASQEDAPKPKTFDPAADAAALVERATALAAKKHKRVLIVWGTDDAWKNPELVQTLKRGRTEDWPFYYEYEVLPIDASFSNPRNAALTAKLAEGLGADIGQLPSVTVLAGSGRSIAHQRASEWVADKKWDEEAIGAFLTEHKVAPLDAEKVLAGQLARAKKEQRRVLIHLGAPW